MRTLIPEKIISMDHLRVASLWTNALLTAFEALGINRNALVKDLPAFANAQTVAGQALDISTARLVWHKAYELSQDDLLGFNVAAHLNFRSSGVLMPICWHSPTPQLALEHIFSFQELISNNGVFRVDKNAEENRFRFEYIPTANAIPASHHQIFAVTISTLGLLLMITDYKALPQSLTVPMEMDRALIEETLGYPVQAHDGHFTVEYALEDLQTHITGRDENLYQLNLSYAEGLIRTKKSGQSLTDKITDIISTEKPASFTVDDVANILNINRRILQRNLSDQGTSFREIRENLLRAEALDLLISKHQSPAEIAQTLGYSDVSAFHRSFKAWFNSTPKQFKSKHMD